MDNDTNQSNCCSVDFFVLIDKMDGVLKEAILVIGEWQKPILSQLVYTHHTVTNAIIVKTEPIASISIESMLDSPSSELLNQMLHNNESFSQMKTITFLNEYSISSLPTLLFLDSTSTIDTCNSFITWNPASDLNLNQSGNNEGDTIVDEWMQKGLDCYENMEMSDALLFFDRVLQLASLSLNVVPKESQVIASLFNSACIYHFWNLPILSLSFLFRVLQHRPTDAVAHTLMWNVATSSEFPPPKKLIVSMYSKLVQQNQDSQAATRLAVLTGQGDGASRTDPEYVRHIFDNLANVFEEKLTVHLQYDAPWILERQVHAIFENENYEKPDNVAEVITSSSVSCRELAQKGQWRIMDLGCGSGLGAKVFREYYSVSSALSANNHNNNEQLISIEDFGRAATLPGIIGIDISQNMIDICQSLCLYQSLACLDVYDAMKQFISGLSQSDDVHAAKLDMILAADTFVYVGALGYLFHLAKELLKHGGFFVFSTEDLEASPMRIDKNVTDAAEDSSVEEASMNTHDIPHAVPGWGAQLLQSARFGHSHQYILALAEKHHFVVSSQVKKTLRTEGTTPLLGNMYVLQLCNDNI